MSAESPGEPLLKKSVDTVKDAYMAVRTFFEGTIINDDQYAYLGRSRYDRETNSWVITIRSSPYIDPPSEQTIGYVSVSLDGKVTVHEKTKDEVCERAKKCAKDAEGVRDLRSVLRLILD